MRLVQQALPHWLAGRKWIQSQIRSRVRENFTKARELLRPPMGWLDFEAGWCLVLTLPANEPDTVVAERLVREARVVVHPGSFYGMQACGRLVVSLLPEEGRFRDGMQRLVSVIGGAGEESS